MPAKIRALDRAAQAADQLVARLGRELREARITRGLSQASVAAAAGLTQARVSRIERGRDHRSTIDMLARFAATVGLELSIRLFPGGQPVRDRAHVALLERFKAAVGNSWNWASEVPLPIAGDKRAWDRFMRGFGLAIGIEAETRPTDMQELGRRLALKKRDGGVDRVILVMPNSAWCRQLVKLNELSAAFPVPGPYALAALREGRDPGGDAIVMI